jgi:hypothetical protein
MTRLSVGCDPEFMLCDNDGILKSAIGVVQGTKENKVDLGNGHRAFYDNVLAEVNIVPGASGAELSQHVQDCLMRLSKIVYPYRLRLQASATYPEKECRHADAKVFGCEPEFDAYCMGIVQAPECKTTFRSAGGHIHLGYSEANYPLMAPIKELDDGMVDRIDRDWGRVWVVRMMDLFMGVPSLWMDQDETSPARRRLYGKAGTHRPKDDYGVEYRATSNFWLKSPKMVQLAYSICAFVVDFVAQGGHEKLWLVNKEDPSESQCKEYDVNGLQEAINTSNKDKAKVFLNGIVKKHMPPALYTSILLACEPAQPGRTNFHKEWGL